VKPGTPFAAFAPYLPDLDILLVMTVEPGFGGQSFMSEMLDKVTAARAEREKKQLRFVIEVDGGITDATARTARAAGADVFVAGNSVFKAPDTRAALAGLRAAIAG
jgi:ribulose-phosphate 3-epimerase